MSTRMSLFFLETFYATFVLFFYLYLILTLVDINPFAIGFHPPTNMEKLSYFLLIIFISVGVVKFTGLFIAYASKNPEERKRIPYIPSQRY